MAQTSEFLTRGRGNGRVRHALKSRTHDVLDDFVELRKDMGKLAQAASRAARSEVLTTGKRLEEIGRDMRTRAGESVGYVTEQVRAHPGATIGLTLGAGVLIGLMLAARR